MAEETFEIQIAPFMLSENGGYTWDSVTPIEIGKAILEHDGYGYEVRHNEDNKNWTLWHSNGSRNSQRGFGGFTELKKYSSEFKDKYDAIAEVEILVGLGFVDGEEWSHVGDRVIAVTQDDYREFYESAEET